MPRFEFLFQEMLPFMLRLLFLSEVILQRRLMERDYVGNPVPPTPIPTDPEQLLADEALEHAGTAVAGSNAFEHGVRLFNRFKAHFDLVKETTAAHEGFWTEISFNHKVN
jgi:hypothetical protein